MSLSKASVRIIPREPAPLDPEQPTVTTLPGFILQRILTYVQDADPKDLRKIASLSSAMYQIAQYSLHHTIHLNLNSRAELARLKLDLIATQRLHLAVRVLKVGWNDPLRQVPNDLSARVCELPSLLPGLVELHWQIAVPWVSRSLLMIQTLPPRVRLYARFSADQRVEIQQGGEWLEGLVGNPNLYSLTISITYRPTEEKECASTMRALKRVLVLCPNLTCPHLYVHYYNHHYNPQGNSFSLLPGSGSPQEQYCGLDFANGERPPAWTDIGLGIHHWGEGCPAGFAMHDRNWGDWNPAGRFCESDYWVDAFDWTQVHTLGSICAELGLKIAPKLTALREIINGHLTGSSLTDEAMSTFLLSMPSGLEKLVVVGWRGLDKKAKPVIRHGDTLRVLRMISPLVWEREHVIAKEDLVQLCNGLPRLEELAIYLLRTEDDWPYEALDAIARLPSLRTLDLNFEPYNVDLPYLKPPDAPDLTAVASLHIFKYLRERNKGLRRLELRAGIHSDHQCGKAWFDAIRFTCEVSVHDGRAEHGYAKITCPDLSSDVNAEIQRQLMVGRKKTSMMEHPEEYPLALKVALDGPILCCTQEYREWEAVKRAKELQEFIANERAQRRARIRGFFMFWSKWSKDKKQK
ncbi:hypothetical protein GGR57DRAFT_106526 [Xylariaceae sp. FL1272]|nr:hypothetical protein GGR57DRAFT_106526 [Xylariaceae sp. FL1272]